MLEPKLHVYVCLASTIKPGHNFSFVSFLRLRLLSGIAGHRSHCQNDEDMQPPANRTTMHLTENQNSIKIDKKNKNDRFQILFKKLHFFEIFIICLNLFAILVLWGVRIPCARVKPEADKPNRLKVAGENLRGVSRTQRNES